MVAARSPSLDPRGFHYLAPLFHLGVQETAEFLRRAAHHFAAVLLESLRHVGQVEDPHDLVAQLVDDVRRRLLGGEQSEPDCVFVTWQAGFRYGRRGGFSRGSGL